MKKELLSRITWPAKIAAIILISFMAFMGYQAVTSPTVSITTAEGSLVEQGLTGTMSDVALAAPSDKNDSESPGSGIIETGPTVVFKACPLEDGTVDDLPDELKSDVTPCTDEQKKLWDEIKAIGGGTPRADQVKLANAGSLTEAAQYLSISTWSNEVGTFASAPDLKSFEWASMISNLISFIVGWIMTMVGWLWMGLMLVVTFAFSADIATRGIHFIDFMTAWITSILTSSTGAMIGIIPLMFLIAVGLQAMALIFPRTGSAMLGTKSGNASMVSATRDALVSMVISIAAFAALVFMGSQAQKNHQMNSLGISQDVSNSQRSAIGNYIDEERVNSRTLQDTGDGLGASRTEVQNSLTANIPVSMLKDPENWTTMSPGWILGNIFKGLNWVVGKIVEVPLTLSQAVNQNSYTGNDVDACSIYLDGKRGLFLSTPAAQTYEMGANLMVSLDILFQRVVLDPYSKAAFSPGGSGQSSYCRVLESRAGTSTGEQVLAMRVSGLYGAIVGTGGMGIIGGEGSSDIVTPGNPWSHTSVEATGGTLVDASGYPAMLTPYDAYATVEGKADDGKSYKEKMTDGLSDFYNAAKATGAAVVDWAANPIGKTVEAGTSLVGDGVEGIKDGVVKEMGGKEEWIDRTQDQSSSIPGQMDVNGGQLDYSSSMTALQRIFGPGSVNTDAEFEALSYFAACRPAIGTKSMRLADTWQGVLQAEPQDQNIPLSDDNCIADSIIGAYSNGGFGGGSELAENAKEFSGDQKAFLYKPRDSDNKRTKLFGFSIGDDLNDRSSMAKLGAARGNALGSQEPVNFYQATSGSIGWSVLIGVCIAVLGGWVVVKYLLKILIGALVSGLLLILAALAWIFTLVLMIIPIQRFRDYFKTASMMVLSSAGASGFVTVIIVMIVSLSKVFEFILTGAVSYVIAGSSTSALYVYIVPLLAAGSVLAAAMSIEKLTKKFLGGASISSWGAITAVSGMAAQPIRNLANPGEEPLFTSWNGKPLGEMANPFKKHENKEVHGDDDVVKDHDTLKNSLLGAVGLDDHVVNDADDKKNETKVLDEDEEYTDLANRAEGAVNLLKDDEDEVATDDEGQFRRGRSATAPTSADQSRLAHALTGSQEYNPLHDLEDAAMADGDVETRLNESGALSSLDDTRTGPNSVNSIMNRTRFNDISQLDLGSPGWSENMPEFDVESARRIFEQALGGMQSEMQQGVNDLASGASESIRQNSAELNRMAGSVDLTPGSMADINRAVAEYETSSGRLAQELNIATAQGITANLSPEVVMRLTARHRASFTQMQSLMQSQLSAQMAPAVASLQASVTQSLATEMTRAIQESTPGLSAAVARPIGASVTRAIREQIRRQTRQL